MTAFIIIILFLLVLVAVWILVRKRNVVLLTGVDEVRQMLSDEVNLVRDVPGLEDRQHGVQVFTARNGAEHSLHRQVVAASMKKQFSPLLQRMVARRERELVAHLEQMGRVDDFFAFAVDFVQTSIALFVYGAGAAERLEARKRIAPWARIVSFVAPPWLARLLEFGPLRAVREARLLDLELGRQDLLRFQQHDGASEEAESLFQLLYVSNRGRLSEADLIANAGIFAAGGTDSTASVLCSCLYVLCRDEQLQQTIRNDSALLRPFLKEVLRLYPPFPIIGYRYARQPYRVGERTIPAGTRMAVNLLETQRAGDAVFRLDDRDESDAALYFPWGAGPRMCVGKPMALAMLNSFVDGLLTKFRLKFASAQCQEPTINALNGVTSPPTPMGIVFEPI